MADFVTWLIESGIGPALVALPVNWGTGNVAHITRRWFRRFRRADDLSRLVRAASGTPIGLTDAEFGAVRQLLEDQQTWTLLGRGTVEDLANLIASCLPAHDGRTAKDSHSAAIILARGLLEFAVADLDPRLFQQLLLARLHRMETDQASALDKALLDVHVDLIARFTDVMHLLKRVLDRLPPGPAQLGEMVVYLKTVIDWLSTDPWPRDLRFSGPALSPAVIERKLQIISASTAPDRPVGQDLDADELQDLDADELAQKCQRLIVLGGPGSGKTWLAKRTARRCAAQALEALAAGEPLDNVELPLYTTCSHLFDADGDIRHAVVSSAIDQLADLGGSRLTAALHVFFTERNAPTLLVIDSLDEARGSDERLFQADTLPWRIVLTSRESSWNRQLVIEDRNDSHKIGELQPLRYPGDVEPFIGRWFEQRPAWGRALSAQIADSPSLQQAATVPLILAFYCIIGGDKPLPEFRHDLYPKVIRRILTGRWRGSNTGRIDADSCLRMLRAWAWYGATTHPASGVGDWADDIYTEDGWLGEADSDAIDHVATPAGPSDLDTGKTLRRFIHRSIREHLVAEYVAGLPTDNAVEVLLPHLWYDPDWEYVTPAAIAMHPQHNQLLRDLICRTVRSDDFPQDLASVDATWESQKLLARIAAESSEADWSPGLADVINRIRVEWARSARVDDLIRTARWNTSNRQAREILLGLLASQANPHEAQRLAGALIKLDPTADDMRQAREALLRMLETDSLPYDEPANTLLKLLASHTVPSGLADKLAQLAPSAEDKKQVRNTLLGLLAGQTRPQSAEQLADALIKLDPTADDMRQARTALLRLLASRPHTVPSGVADTLAQLAPSAEDKKQVRNTLLGLLAGQTRPQSAEQLADALIKLDPTADDMRQARTALLRLLASPISPQYAERLTARLISLNPTVEDVHEARDALLSLLNRSGTEPWVASDLMKAAADLAMVIEDQRQAREILLGMLVSQVDPGIAAELAGRVILLAPTAEDQRQAREVLVKLLVSRTDPNSAVELISTLIQLKPTADDKRQTRRVLLDLLGDPWTDEEVAGELAGWLIKLEPTVEDQRQARQELVGLLDTGHVHLEVAEDATDALVQLATTAEDQRQTREALISLLSSDISGIANVLTDALVRLATTAEDQRQTREALISLLGSDQVNHWTVEHPARALVRLATTAEDQDQTREALISLLSSRKIHPWVAWSLASGVVQLGPTADDERRARQALLALLASQTDPALIHGLVHGLVELGPTADDERRARQALLALLASQTDPALIHGLVHGLVELGPTADDERRARQALLALLASQTDPALIHGLVHGLVELGPTADDERQARQALLALLASETDPRLHELLADSVAELHPTVHDLSTCRTWTIQPPATLLAAVRRNSALPDWLAALPTLLRRPE